MVICLNNIKNDINKLLIGGDLRSIGQSSKIVTLINNQEDFDSLFNFINNSDRLIVMRAVDCIEKITKREVKYLDKHKNEIIQLCEKAVDKELKWHLAQLISRLNLTNEELNKLYLILKKWVLDQNESKIVRANALESLYEIIKMNETMKEDFTKVINIIKKENIPSLNARIKKIKL